MMSWREFKIGDLFEIRNGKKYPKQNRDVGTLPLVSTSAFNNGVSDYIKYRSDSTYKNCLTVAYSGSVGATFYHENEVFVGETVIALLPKFEMNRNIGLYLSALLTRHNQKYSYEYKLKVLGYNDEIIMLPVDFNGNPNWSYMETYMKTIEEKAKKKISLLN